MKNNSSNAAIWPDQGLTQPTICAPFTKVLWTALGRLWRRQKGLNTGQWAMKKILFAIGTLALGLTATAPAHADYAIVKFNSGYCRIYDNTALPPPDGTFVWFVWGYHRYYRLPTLPIAQHKLGLVIARHLCWHY